MIGGSRLTRVQHGRNAQGVQSRRAKRTSKVMPFLGQVFGSQEMLSLPAGQVITLRSQSTWNAALVSPPSTRACQLVSAATGPTLVVPYRRGPSTSTCESVYPLSTRCSDGSSPRRSRLAWTTATMLSSGVVAGGGSAPGGRGGPPPAASPGSG